MNDAATDQLRPADGARIDATVPAPRRVGGVRVSAWIEMTAFLAVALAIDHFWGQRDRFAALPLHPFWIVVLLAAGYYGLREGMMAAAMASAALLIGNLPEQRLDEERYHWLLHIALLPLAWLAAAFVLGEISDAQRRRTDALRRERDAKTDDLRVIARSHAELETLNARLEARIASQLRTVSTLYKGWQALDRDDADAVLLGSTALTRTVMAADKLSVYRHQGGALVHLCEEGWEPTDTYLRRFDAASPLYRAVVGERRFLSVADPADEAALGGEGSLAGPIVDRGSDEVVAMLKIDAIGFLELDASSLIHLRVLCDWIGAAWSRARRIAPSTPRAPLPP